MSLVKRLGLIVGAALTLGLVSGCTSITSPPQGTSTPAESPRAGSASSAVASAPATTPATTSASSPGTATVRTDPDAPAGQCSDSHLAVSVQNDPTGSGAGQRLSYVVFRNTGPTACVLRGAPGVSLVGGGNGTQVGAAADRETGGAAVRIQPGAYALAALTFPAIDKNGGAYGDGDGHDPQCKAEPADGYRVYPPHSFRAFFSTDKTYGCSTNLQTLHVGGVESASKYPDFTPQF